MNRVNISSMGEWHDLHSMLDKKFVCGFCNITVASVYGYKFYINDDCYMPSGIYICPNCGCPNFFSPTGIRYPAAALGSYVKNLPPALYSLYEEVRCSSSQGCFTGAVLLCRKMLMNVAVQQGAKEGLKFIEYVDYLADKGYVPPNGRYWVDHIRKKGNEAAHEIAVMKEEDVSDLITFIEMLLRFIYEFPNKIPVQSP